jgi:hypothetical protein
VISISKTFGSGFTLTAQAEIIQDAIGEFTDSCAYEFLQEKACGCCRGVDIVPHRRVVADPTDKKGKATFTYYEMKCLRPGCWATLEIGQRKDGGLYPKRKGADGNYLPNSGWKAWKSKQEEGDA